MFFTEPLGYNGNIKYQGYGQRIFQFRVLLLPRHGDVIVKNEPTCLGNALFLIIYLSNRGKQKFPELVFVH